MLTLYPPSEHAAMYTVGDIVKVHSNGRINYRGQETRPDGSEEQSERALNASLKLEEAIRCASRHKHVRHNFILISAKDTIVSTFPHCRATLTVTLITTTMKTTKI